MTEEEARKLQQDMAEQGIPIGQWTSVAGGPVQTKSFQDQKELLVQIRNLLEGQLASDLKQLDDAKRQLDQAKHGGGR